MIDFLTKMEIPGEVMFSLFWLISIIICYLVTRYCFLQNKLSYDGDNQPGKSFYLFTMFFPFINLIVAFFHFYFVVDWNAVVEKFFMLKGK